MIGEDEQPQLKKPTVDGIDLGVLMEDQRVAGEQLLRINQRHHKKEVKVGEQVPAEDGARLGELRLHWLH